MEENKRVHDWCEHAEYEPELRLFRCKAPASKQCDFKTVINWKNYCTGLKIEDYERAAKNG